MAQFGVGDLHWKVRTIRPLSLRLRNSTTLLPVTGETSTCVSVAHKIAGACPDGMSIDHIDLPIPRIGSISRSDFPLQANINPSGVRCA
jgi:hypothetical protein